MTRRRASTLLLLPLAALGCGADPAPTPPTPPTPPEACRAYAFRDTGTLRVFAVQPRVSTEHLASYASYRDHLMGLVESRIKPCLAKDRPNLIAFPEDVGLPAAFLGSRGKGARVKADVGSALLALISTYGPAVSYYAQKWPDLGLFEGLFLGATDTLQRAFAETMAAVATSTGAFVVASTNISGAVEKSTSPADLKALRDPDLPDTPYVYVAKDRAVYNTAFVFDPSGAVIGQARKPYLVPSEGDLLGFTGGPLAEVGPLAVAGQKLAVLTSKDAWMPDVVDRQATLGAKVFLQPEAFSGWAIEEQPGDWLPDVFHQSAWAAVQKHSGLRNAVIPHLTGNLFDQVFDGQSAVLGDAMPGEAHAGYIGQEPQGGFLTVADWVIPDPGSADASLSLAARRDALRLVGQALLPDGERENGYVETVVAADIAPDAPYPAQADGPPGVLGASQPLTSAGEGEQTRPALATDGANKVFAVWQEEALGLAQVYIASSSDGGKSFGAPHAVAASTKAQLTPTVVATSTSIEVAFQERDGATSRILTARSVDGGATFGAPIAVSLGEPDAWAPVLAADAGGVYLAFVASIGGNERIALATMAPGSDVWQTHLVDVAPPFPPRSARNNQWAPAVAANGAEVAVAWVDFRQSQWDVLAARSTDGGQTFSPPVRIDDGTDAPERLNDDPALAFLPGGPLVAGWSDVRLRRAPAKARASVAESAKFAASTVLGGAPDDASAWRPRFTALSAQTMVAVWQDFRGQSNDVYLARSDDLGATWSAGQRVDDGGDGDSQQWAPAVAALGSTRVVIAWEDSRTGRRRLRFVAGSP